MFLCLFLGVYQKSGLYTRLRKQFRPGTTNNLLTGGEGLVTLWIGLCRAGELLQIGFTFSLASAVCFLQVQCVWSLCLMVHMEICSPK